jgi:hypothetical protein
MAEGLTAGGIIAGVLMLLGWGFKRMVTATIAQNRELVTSALLNMKANTVAIETNTTATRELAQSIKEDRIVREERDKTLFKQLDKIENKIERRH